MTYDFDIDRYQYSLNSETRFINIYDETEYNCLVEECKNLFNRDFTNGVCVRLDSCEKDMDGCTEIGLSQIHFYDFLLTNFAYFNREKILAELNTESRNVFNRLFNQIDADGGLDSFSSIINKEYLSNALAISCLLTDGKSVLMTKRNGKTGISDNFYSTTVTGSVDGDDLKARDPVIACCIREFGEEMNGILDPDQMVMDRIVCGKNKVQPIALVNVHVDNLERFAKDIKDYSRFFEESSSYSICSYDKIKCFLKEKNAKITEAARRHLEGILE